MKKLINYISLLFVVLSLAACGGGSGDGDFVNDGSGSGGANQVLDSLSVTSSTPSINADGSETATITVVARDTTGAVMEGESITFSSDSGSVTPAAATTDANGNAVTTLSTGNNSAARTIIVTATSGGITGSVSVDVVPVPTTLTITSSTANIASDGSETATITALALDANNSLLAGVPVNFSATSGGLQGNNPVATNANGEAVITLTTGGDNTSRDITVTATTSALSAATVVSVVPSGSVDITSLELLTDPSQLGSAGNVTATITALVKDENNNLVEGVPVQFSADSGGISVTQGTTNAAGQATAVLSVAGDNTNRTINVTATAGTLTQTITVDVVGSSLAINGPTSLVQNANGTYTVTLSDSAGTGIGGQVLSVSSANGNTLSATSLTTDSLGRAEFDLTAVNGGADTITLTGLGLTTELPITVSADEFMFIAPTAGTEVNIGDTITATVEYSVNGVPQVGETINFSTLRGTLSALTAVTDASGQASVDISSADAGANTITATTASGLSTNVDIEFIATTPASLQLQINPFSVAINEQAAVIATVRDASNNRVKNQTVTFDLEDITGGTLSAGSAVTDSQGRAQIFYNASDIASAANGVTITATVQNLPAVTDQATLTVTGVQAFIALNTGNSIEEPNVTQYVKQFVVQVTDTAGVGVAGVNLTMKVVPADTDLSGNYGYYKGYWQFDVAANIWVPIYTITNALGAELPCLNEDENFNGIFDASEVDSNADGVLTPGNVATVSPGSVVTDASGFAFVNVTYGQDLAAWMDVELIAEANVSGTEARASRIFRLQASATDLANEASTPGVGVSPFGKGDPALGNNTCANPL